MHTMFWLQNANVRGHWEDLTGITWEVVDWIKLAQGQWRALVNTVVNLRVPQKVGSFLTS
jgi:hypothetical protein